MSLPPARGTEGPESPNGVVNSMSAENGLRDPESVKCSQERAPEDGETLNGLSQKHTDKHSVGGSKVYHAEACSDTETDNNQRTGLSLHYSHMTGTSHGPDSESTDTASPEASDAVQNSGGDLLWDSLHHVPTKHSSMREEAGSRGRRLAPDDERDDGEKEKQDEEEHEKSEFKHSREEARNETQSLRHYSSSAPGSSTASSSSPPPLLSSEDAPCPPHVMAQVWVRNVRGMQDSKSLDEISQACGGASGSRGAGRGGQSEGRRATISSALELEGTVSHDGDLTHFITKNLEQKIKMSSKPSLDCSDSDCSGPIYRSRGLSRKPADIPPIDPVVLVDLQKHAQEIAQSVEMMMRSLNGTIQNMTALSVGYIQTYRDSVDSLGESVDMSIKGMYTLMARCEELDRSMQPIHTLAAQIRDVKRTLDALEAICK
ncbi:BLOC-1-related complex subunit 6 isoform 1-T3 [Synchiropus picturatus]